MAALILFASLFIIVFLLSLIFGIFPYSLCLNRY